MDCLRAALNDAGFAETSTPASCLLTKCGGEEPNRTTTGDEERKGDCETFRFVAEYAFSYGLGLPSWIDLYMWENLAMFLCCHQESCIACRDWCVDQKINPREDSEMPEMQKTESARISRLYADLFDPRGILRL